MIFSAKDYAVILHAELHPYGVGNKVRQNSGLAYFTDVSLREYLKEEEIVVDEMMAVEEEKDEGNTKKNSRSGRIFQPKTPLYNLHLNSPS